MATRTAVQRRADTLDALRKHRDVWIVSADASGEAHLIPLSYLWDGQRLTMATPEASKTIRNLRRAGRCRVALPSADDVVIIDSTIDFVPIDAAAGFADAHAAATGFDPRVEPQTYVYIRLTPSRIQAWRDVAELAGRTIMRGGQWVND